MKNLLLFALSILSLTSAQGVIPNPLPKAPEPVEDILRLQIFLDAKLFGPGKLDGRPGEFTTKALKRYQMANGLTQTELETHTLDLSSVAECYTTYTIRPEDLKFVGDLPSKPSLQAKKKYLPYDSVLEFLTERFHCSPELIEFINQPMKMGAMKPGDAVKVPNVVPFLIEELTEIAALPEVPEFQSRVIKIDTREKLLGLWEGEKLIASLPITPAPPSASEREAASSVPGLRRGLHMISLGLRSEGVREWNFTLRGMGDRELQAAAQLACEREVWDRCINTSDRTKAEINLAQRFPTPFRQDVVAAARQIGLDPAYVYGLIRQESRFIMDARSHVGASGLMQLMPATARWTAKKIGLDFKPEMINDREVNLRLGTAYLKLVLDDFGGSAAMAAAAYNAGPSRPRRWREGPLMEVAAWAENIPFNETRDYVKKVLSNATVYAALLEGAPTLALKARLGSPIGPRDGNAPSPDKELP